MTSSNTHTPTSRMQRAPFLCRRDTRGTEGTSWQQVNKRDSLGESVHWSRLVSTGPSQLHDAELISCIVYAHFKQYVYIPLA